MWRKILFNAPNSKIKRLYLRKKSTSEEQILWNEIKNNKLNIKFKRQYSIGPYIVDFFSSKQKLVIEVDGLQHTSPDAIKYDDYRTKYFNNLGLTVLRFSNTEIYEKLEKVLSTIASYAPSTEAGEGVGG